MRWHSDSICKSWSGQSYPLRLIWVVAAITELQKLFLFCLLMNNSRHISRHLCERDNVWLSGQGSLQFLLASPCLAAATFQSECAEQSLPQSQLELKLSYLFQSPVSSVMSAPQTRVSPRTCTHWGRVSPPTNCSPAVNTTRATNTNISWTVQPPAATAASPSLKVS